MSVLTKIFVVALIVLSLVLSAATITFVSSIDDYKRTLDASKASEASLTSQLAEESSRAAIQSKQKDEALIQATTALNASQTEQKNLAQQMADLGKQLASKTSDATIASANVAKLTSAVSALQTTSTAYQAQVAELRSGNDRLQTQNGDLNVALSDQTNKLSITEDQRRVLAEQLTELRGQLDRVAGALRDRGVDPSRITSGGLAAGAPAINGVIRDTRQIAGIPHAKISVGSEDSVKVGMEFNILDRSNGRFLGKLTVVAVEPNEAVGRLTGPDITAIAAGAEVRTQL